MLTEKNGFRFSFIDVPARPWNEEQVLKNVVGGASDAKFFVLDNSTPSIKSDRRFAEKLKEKNSNIFIVLVGIIKENMANVKVVDAIARKEYDVTIFELARFDD